MLASTRVISICSPIKSLLKTSTKRYFSASTGELKKTALHDLHVKLGAKMVDFAGYAMPVQYTDTIMNSHMWCRQKASLFDVSHMGQLRVHGPKAKDFLEHLSVADLSALEPGAASYSYFTNDKGGIVDDTIITNWGESYYVVVNAACFEKDMAHFSHHLKSWKDVQVTPFTDRSLIAVQGPAAEAALSKAFNHSLSDVKFMHGVDIFIDGVGRCWAQRSGYTGEDGFEISVPTASVEKLTNMILANPIVKPAGLGARDLLRLEAGLGLYGNDMDENTTPKQAGLTWAISANRRKTGGFLGDKIILDQIKDVTPCEYRKVGLHVQGPPAREHTPLHDPETKAQIGEICSGGYSPVLQKGIAMAFVKEKYMKSGTKLQTNVRGKFYDAVTTKMPFVPHNYKRD